MVKLLFLTGVILLALIAESSSQHVIRPTYRPPRGGPIIIRPTYRPPPSSGPIIRTVREAGNGEPQWLFKDVDIPRAPASGDHPFLPSIIDDIKLDPNTRAARSLDSPSARRGGGSQATSGSSRNPGPTHPGYNRRNTREIRLPKPFDPHRPSPVVPLEPFDPVFRPVLPRRQPYPIYARTTRDVVIPNWNPNARAHPWQRLGVKPRRTRSVERGDLDSHDPRLRNARSVEILEDESQDD